MKIDTKQYIADLQAGNKELFDVSRTNARNYFNSDISKEELVEHFVGRMVNERMNLTSISAKVASADANTPAEELEELSRQAYDEGVHFRIVKEIVEHIGGKEIDLEETLASEAASAVADGNFAKGATLLDKYKASDDEVALALYQFIGEGRAEQVWDEMANCIDDEYISSRYAKISSDEGFHARIGARKLEKLINADPSVTARIDELAPQMREDLRIISEENTRVKAVA